MAATSQATQIALLMRDVARHDRELDESRDEITNVRIDVARMGARLAVYATLGATVGGALVAGATTAIVHALG